MQPDRDATEPGGASRRGAATSDSDRIEAQLARVRARLAAGMAEVRALSAEVARLEQRVAEARESQEQRPPPAGLAVHLRALAEALADQEAANQHAANTLAALEQLLRVARAAEEMPAAARELVDMPLPELRPQQVGAGRAGPPRRPRTTRRPPPA